MAVPAAGAQPSGPAAASGDEGTGTAGAHAPAGGPGNGAAGGSGDAAGGPAAAGARGGTGAGGPRLGRAAALIGGLTAVSRVVGFARILVFTYAVGYTVLGGVYQTANTIPNIIFEIVASGALAALVVPLIAGAISRGDRAEVSQTASGLLTWVVLLLVPLALVVALAARPIIGLLDTGASPPALAVGTTMLRVFAPQLPLYGVGIVLSGLLQAHRRFAWPVLAPLLSSLTVIGAYLCYTAVWRRHLDIPAVSLGGQLVLSVGTTLGVVVLSLSLVVPVRRLGLRVRPTLRMGESARSAVRGLAWVGVLTAASQQLTLGLLIALANWRTPKGSLVMFTQSQTVYLVPWAVLAVPVATSSYPALATAIATGARRAYQEILARATRSVLLLSALGAAALVTLAWPMGWVLARLGSPSAHHTVTGTRVGMITAAITGFAPGLLGYGLFALHSRALYAMRRNRWAAVATLTGWGCVAAVAVLLSLTLPARDRVPALTAANSVGMLVMGAVLVAVIARWAGRGALAGVRRAGLSALAAGTLAAAAGILARWPLTGSVAHPGLVRVAAGGVLSGIVVALVFAGVAVLVDRHDARPLLARLVRRAGLRRLPGTARPPGTAGPAGGDGAQETTGGER